jgi:hypothetical protein
MDGVMKEYLKGKKTYLVSIGMVMSGIGAGFGLNEDGSMNLMDCNWELMDWSMILNGLGLSTLRAGLAKYVPMLRK